MDKLITVIPSDQVTTAYKKEAKTWSKWDSKNRKSFPFFYATEERVLILEGLAEITPNNGGDTESASGTVITISKGDAVTFHKGLKCKWKILKRMKKHYIVEKADDDDVEAAVATITCDVCDQGCEAESYFLADEEQDICPACYVKDKRKYVNAEHQKDGKKWVEPDDGDDEKAPKKKKRKTKA
ncbi:hypothetical protein MHU86_10808 [Fragilaria crotonensis]|nr:hypothetical protein MHU86_10808 [Fragilaria crotonensis]